MSGPRYSNWITEKHYPSEKNDVHAPYKLYTINSPLALSQSTELSECK